MRTVKRVIFALLFLCKGCGSPASPQENSSVEFDASLWSKQAIAVVQTELRFPEINYTETGAGIGAPRRVPSYMVWGPDENLGYGLRPCDGRDANVEWAELISELFKATTPDGAMDDPQSVSIELVIESVEELKIAMNEAAKAEESQIVLSEILTHGNRTIAFFELVDPFHGWMFGAVASVKETGSDHYSWYFAVPLSGYPARN